MTKNICFINNYNNANFLRECLRSVYRQTHSFDQVIIVDDGSTDSSLQIIDSFKEQHTNLLLLQKSNEGQISTFNHVVNSLPDSAQVFLLDGDDLYPFDYLELTLNELGNEGWDFAFCEQQKFVNCDWVDDRSAKIAVKPPFLLSTTSALTRSRGCWIGNPTSCISLSSRLFKSIFPYPYYRDKIFWVDDLLIFSSSIMGAKKIHIPSLGVGWRSHGNNVTKKSHSADDVRVREESLRKIFKWYCSKYQIPRFPGILEFYREYEALGEYWRVRLDLPGHYRMINRLLRDRIKQYFRS